MKKIFILLLVFCMMVSFATCSKQPAPEEGKTLSSSGSEAKTENKEDVPYIGGWTADFEPSDFDTPEEYDEAFLTEWAKSLEPIEVFETESEYPVVIKDIFEILIEKDEYYHGAIIKGITVLGDENEFFVTYSFIGETGENRGIDPKSTLSVRIRKTDEGKFALIARGGGPLGHGLEKSDITFEEVWQQEEKDDDAAMNEWLESLEPIEILDTKTVFPEVIGEIFETMMEKEPEEKRANKVKMVEVFGGENEFFVHYKYSSEASEFGDLRIRVRLNNSGIYTLIAEGDGPLYFGLGKNNLTLEETGLG